MSRTSALFCITVAFLLGGLLTPLDKGWRGRSTSDKTSNRFVQRINFQRRYIDSQRYSLE